MTKSKFGTLRSGFALDIAVVAQRAAAGVDEPAAATFVWDVQTQILFENADLERVAEIAGSKCPRCHGNDGITPPEDQDLPNPAGQHAVDLFKQSKDYQAEMRENRGMLRRVKDRATGSWPMRAAWYVALNPAHA